MTSNFRLQVVLNHLLGSQNLSVKRTSAVEYSNFKYTLDNGILSNEQRAFYEENGYLVFHKLIDPDLIERCRQHFLDICNGVVDKGHMTLMKDKSLRHTDVKGEHLYYKAQDVLYDDVFSQYMLHPDILDIVEAFTGPDITAVHSMLINKPPDSGKMTSIHPMHQDLHYFPFRPAERIVASWTAMEKINEENGCLFVIPGTHKLPLQPHDYPETDVNKAFHGVIGFEKVPRVLLRMEMGDTVFFHPQLLHGSGPNFSNRFRKAISCHYASSNCHYIDVKGTTQENVADEIVGMAKRRGLNCTYEEIWRYRSRLVRGEGGALQSY